MRGIRRFVEFADGNEITKEIVLQFKQELRKEMSPVSVSSIIAAVNAFLKFLGLGDLCVKAFKIQHRLFSIKKELYANEYRAIVKAAFKTNNERLALIIQTICSTGSASRSLNLLP